MLNETHDPALRSWVETANSPATDFPIQNLPFGVFRLRGSQAATHIGVAIGDQVLDVLRCRQTGLLTGLPDALQQACGASILNRLMALGADGAAQLRRRLIDILKTGAPMRNDVLVPMEEAELGLPAAIGDYTDFYASIFHATNVGGLFRPDNPLLPNYKHVPIAYHGRTSSMVIGGTWIQRPWGQTKRAEDSSPAFRASERLDYEAEVAAFIGAGNEMGHPLSIDDAERHIFGLCLLNDWSARDIQAWEYQPLGPFLAKNFATSISPWVVTLEALAPFRCPAFVRPESDPKPLPYLSAETNETAGGFDLTVEVYLQSAHMRASGLPAERLSHGSLRDMYWTLGQMVAHHTSNGCNLRPGDVLATGTVSGPEEGSRGCLLEITRGSHSIQLPGGEERLFLADGDEVILRGFCERAGFARIGFGECTGLILPAEP
jgi:fumarylacetoacetase